MPDIDPLELEKVSDAIARPAIRKAFALNPVAALEQAGVKIDAVPAEVIDLLADLSPWELEVLGRVAAQAKRLPAVAELRDHNGVIIH